MDEEVGCLDRAPLEVSSNEVVKRRRHLPGDWCGRHHCDRQKDRYVLPRRRHRTIANEISRVSFLPPVVVAVSFAHYYQPARVMLTGVAPWGDVLVLLIWGAVFWSIGLFVWRRRSVLTI